MVDRNTAAAVVMQSVIRVYLARLYVRRLRIRRQEERLFNMARKIQCLSRQFIAKAYVNRLRRVREERLRRQREEAAIKIQVCGSQSLTQWGYPSLTGFTHSYPPVTI